ncbi:MAG: hypothetical protein VKS61_07890 [Candidatus Sericytochromatia bacterium]|nr:hypothetical protein [Candidatus Sericytochromatia bacterium]
MAQTAVGVAAVAALACLGGGFLWASWQLGRLLQQVRQELLPELTASAKALQANLSQLELLTRNTDETVQEAHEIVAAAQRGVQRAEHVAGEVRRVVLQEGSLRVLAAAAGVAAGWRVLRGRRACTSPPAEAPEPATGGSPLDVEPSSAPL